MNLNNIEFYSTPEGDVMVKPVGAAAYQLTENDRDFIEQFLAIMRDRYPEAHKKLMEVYSRNSMNRWHYEFRVVTRFIRCNFGEYDQYNHDINASGVWKFEEVRCPLRGECTCENIICRPKLNRNLTDREMEVYRLIVDNLQADEIAEKLCLSPNTVNRHRENIKAKLGCRNVGELVNFWHQNGLGDGK